MITEGPSGKAQRELRAELAAAIDKLLDEHLGLPINEGGEDEHIGYEEAIGTLRPKLRALVLGEEEARRHGIPCPQVIAMTNDLDLARRLYEAYAAACDDWSKSLGYRHASPRWNQLSPVFRKTWERVADAARPATIEEAARSVT